ncbi:hypothetical protein, partial [Burkholderia oklahomensis]|uniref:hypothetical protein n=1 Tax=Burkholderia oklahomensis TaxID=342113 RepID=UPI0012FD7DC1
VAARRGLRDEAVRVQPFEMRVREAAFRVVPRGALGDPRRELGEARGNARVFRIRDRRRFGRGPHGGGRRALVRCAIDASIIGPPRAVARPAAGLQAPVVQACSARIALFARERRFDKKRSHLRTFRHRSQSRNQSIVKRRKPSARHANETDRPQRKRAAAPGKPCKYDMDSEIYYLSAA